MGLQRTVLRWGLAMAAVASGCGTGALQPTGGAGPDGGSACQGLGESDCNAHPGCKAGACSLCGGPSAFSGCYDPTHESPPACLAVPCVASPCTSFDEATCRAHPECQAFSCTDCSGVSTFASCGVAGAANFNCPATTCPLRCSQVTTQAVCDARGDCHSVFSDLGNCDCQALGCCAHFSGCADGATATCQPPSSTVCMVPPPYCEQPYVVSYTSNCYEGCVPSTECGP